MSDGIKRPRVLEIQTVLDPPKTYDEALALRARLIAETDRLQDELSVETDMTVRYPALASLRKKRALLRQVKEWLRRNDVVKMSEWELLGRAHQFLEEVASFVRDKTDDGHQNALDAEREALLDAIELVVPGQYLKKGERP